MLISDSAAQPDAGAIMRRVTVLMAVPQYPYPVVGGLERQAHELAKALTEVGVRPKVVSGKVDPHQPAQEWVEGIEVHRIPWSHRKWLRFIRTPFDLVWVFYRQRRTYDVVHLHQFSWFGLFVIALARLLSKPVLTKLPNVAERGLPGLTRSKFGMLRLAIFKLTDGVVAMSKQSLDELDAVGFPLRRVLATPNGISVSPDRTGSVVGRPGHARSRVVFVGRLSEGKGLEDLLYAWTKVVAVAGDAARLELWGDGPLEIELRKMCTTLGLDDSVILRGHVESVRDELMEVDILVLPSMTEGNSNAILEAMAAGLPIVSTRVGGTPMLVGADGARFLVDPGDWEALYDRLVELIGDEALRRRIGETMRQRVQVHFDIKRVARTYAAAYSLLMAGRRNELDKISNPVITER